MTDGPEPDGPRPGRTPLTPSRYESVIDKQIRLAQERGDFDDLPGTGQPIPGAGAPADELWWVKGLIAREGLSTEPLLPRSVQLRKELDRLPQTLDELRTEAEVRAVVGGLNERVVAWIRTPSGPPVRLGPVDIEEALARWRARRPTQVRRSPVAEQPARTRRWWQRR